MKPFVRFLFVSIFLFVIIAFVSDVLITAALSKFHKRSKISLEQLDYDVVYFGSSRAIHHFHTPILNESLESSHFNMGWAAVNPREIYAAVSIYLKKNRKPRTIIIQLDNEQNDTTIDALAKQDVLRVFPCYKSLDYLDENLKFEHKFPLLTFVKNRDLGWREWLKMAFKNDAPIRDYGYVGLGIKNNFRSSAVVDTAQVMVKNRWIEMAINECKNYSINVVLLTTPYFRIAKSENFNALKFYSVPYYNFSDSLNSRIFYTDNSHLNALGADSFTRLMLKVVKEIR